MADINVGQISEALNDKTDRDFNNMNPSALSKETIVGWGMPDYSAAISITPPFTAPKAGIVIIEQKWTNTYIYTTVNGYKFISQLNASNSGQQSAGAIVVNQDDVITTNGSWAASVFIPFKGVN